MSFWINLITSASRSGRSWSERDFILTTTSFDCDTIDRYLKKLILRSDISKLISG